MIIAIMVMMVVMVIMVNADHGNSDAGDDDSDGDIWSILSGNYGDGYFVGLWSKSCLSHILVA